MSRLTLTIDGEVLARAKRYAKEYEVSMSKLIETYLDGLTDSPTPVLDQLRGVLKKANLKGYRRHLATKYP
jgi:hypothetical protein